MTKTEELREDFRDTLREAKFPDSEGLHRTFDVKAVEDWVVRVVAIAEQRKAKEIISWIESGIDEAIDQDPTEKETLETIARWARIKFLDK